VSRTDREVDSRQEFRRPDDGTGSIEGSPASVDPGCKWGRDIERADKRLSRSSKDYCCNMRSSDKVIHLHPNLLMTSEEWGRLPSFGRLSFSTRLDSSFEVSEGAKEAMGQRASIFHLAVHQGN
jgi:hypothetical protein